MTPEKPRNRAYLAMCASLFVSSRRSGWPNAQRVRTSYKHEAQAGEPLEHQSDGKSSLACASCLYSCGLLKETSQRRGQGVVPAESECLKCGSHDERRENTEPELIVGCRGHLDNRKGLGEMRRAAGARILIASSVNALLQINHSTRFARRSSKRFSGPDIPGECLAGQENFADRHAAPRGRVANG